MQSAQFGAYMASMGWQVEPIAGSQQTTYLYIRKMPVLGVVAKAPKARWPFPFEKLAAAVEQRGKPVVIRIEPNMLLPEDPTVATQFIKTMRENRYGSTWKGAELKTIQVDLRPDPTTIFASIPRENTKRNIRAAEKNGLTAGLSNDLKVFYDLHAYTAKKKHFFLPSFTEVQSIYQNFEPGKGSVIILVWSKQGTVLAGVLLIIHHNIAYYRYVGTTDEGIALRAPTYAVWQSFLLTKALGCQTFDFFGVNDPRNQQKQFVGFTHFKEGFSTNSFQLLDPIAKYYPPVGTLMHLFDGI